MKIKVLKRARCIFATIQKVSESFFLPVSILPIAGVLLGLGASFTNGTTISAYNLNFTW